MKSNRRHLRMKEDFRVHWILEESLLGGQGTALDMSVSGMQIITDQYFVPKDGCVMFVESMGDQTFLPKPRKCKITWFKKINQKGVDCLHCGLEFI